MRTYMARLGDFQFGMDTAAFNELKRASAWRWEAKNRIGRKPAMQNTGRDADTITLSGTIYPHWRGGLGQMAALRAMADTGEAQPLVYAFENSGQYCGLWCITAIDETRTVLFDNGAPRKIDFNLSLREYGEDSDLLEQFTPFLEALEDQVDADEAVEQAENVEAEVEAIETQEEAVAAAPSVVDTITSVTASISDGVSKVMNSDAVRLAKKAVTTVNELKGRADAMVNAAKGLKAALDNPSQLPSALSSMGTAAGAATEAMTKAASGMGLTAGKYNGASAGSLYSEQIGSAVGVVNKLASASDSIKSTANKLGSLV